MSSRRPSDERPGTDPAGEDPRPADLDLERDLPTTPEDVAVLRRLRDRPVTAEEYAALLRAMGHASREELARRRGPRGEPFEL